MSNLGVITQCYLALGAKYASILMFRPQCHLVMRAALVVLAEQCWRGCNCQQLKRASQQCLHAAAAAATF
eukprot:3167864-Amphidinium_carterae.1